MKRKDGGGTSKEVRKAGDRQMINAGRRGGGEEAVKKVVCGSCGQRMSVAMEEQMQARQRHGGIGQEKAGLRGSTKQRVSSGRIDTGASSDGKKRRRRRTRSRGKLLNVERGNDYR